MPAAIMSVHNQPLVIDDAELEEPGTGEVIIRLVATGVCHTDLGAFQGAKPVTLPIVLGHEGAGVVEAIGPYVTTTRPGDHVLLAVAPRCGKCSPYILGRPERYQQAGTVLYSGTLINGTTRLRWRRQPLHHFFAQSSFAEGAIVAEGSVVPVRPDAPLAQIAPLVCGAATGLGAVLNMARVEVGTNVPVIDCGGVGLSAIMGSHLARAGKIIAIGIADEKLELAQSRGATAIVNANRTDPALHAVALTNGGADYAFECVGSETTLTQLVELLAPGRHGYVLGAGPVGTRFTSDLNRFLFNWNLHGVIAGNMRAAVDLPRWVDLYMRGDLPLDRLVTRTYSLDSTNTALDKLGTGASGRGVIICRLRSAHTSDVPARTWRSSAVDNQS